jgi:hypothetical protein
MGIGEDKAPRECEVVAVGSFGSGTLFGNYTEYVLARHAPDSHVVLCWPHDGDCRALR